MKDLFLVLVLASLIACPAASLGWDYFYDGSVLPNDTSLGATSWGVGGTSGGISMCTTDGDLLRIGDGVTNAVINLARNAGPGPITMEARLRSMGDSGGSSSGMAIGTESFSTSIAFFSTYVRVGFDYGNPPILHYADMTSFHTVRIAIDAQGQAYVWMDQTLIAQGLTHVAGPGAVGFGGSSENGEGVSYWDYVAYSHSFEPVPEPSSLLALLAGVGGLGALMRRRRR